MLKKDIYIWGFEKAAFTSTDKEEQTTAKGTCCGDFYLFGNSVTQLSLWLAKEQGGKARRQ